MLAVLSAKGLMKTFLSIVVLLTFTSVAWGGAILTVGDSIDYEAVGNMVEVDVTIFGLPATLNSYQLDVDFTPGVLWALGSGSGTIDNVDGTISGITGHNVGMNFGGTLFRLYFNAAGWGTDFLSIPTSSVILLDSSGNNIPFTTAGGRVYVDGAAPVLTPEPRSLWLLLTGMLAIAAWHLKRRCSVSQQTQTPR
jgi:hypothetical protein